MQLIFSGTETDYIKNEVFVQLIPALVETLNKAKIWQAFTRDKCFFNGIDHVVQVEWFNCDLTSHGLTYVSILHDW